MRHNTLPSRKVVRVKEQPQHGICVGCYGDIKEGFNRTGSVISGLAFRNVQITETTPITAVIETYERSYVIGGDSTTINKRVPFNSRRKGRLCEDCCANYHTVKWTSKSGEERCEQIVKVDAVAGFFGNTIIPAYEK